MSLETRYPGHIVIAEDPQTIVFGTCMLGNTFGSAESANIKRTADVEELEKCGGNLLAAILRKPRFELSLKTLFSSNVTPPGIGELIVFPLANVQGRILNVDIDWEKAGQRQLSIEAKSWDAFNGTYYGAGKAYYNVNPEDAATQDLD